MRSGRVVASRFLACFLMLLFSTALGQPAGPLPGTQPLTEQLDLSAGMVAGIDRFLSLETERSMVTRKDFWRRDFSSAGAYEHSIEANRDRFRRIIGAVDEIEALTGRSPYGHTNHLAETAGYTVSTFRWPVFQGVNVEGLLLSPRSNVVARVVALPDADQEPELLVGLIPGLEPAGQWGRRLVENGCEVIIPVLVSRENTFSGNPKLSRLTNQPHREWIYRQAFELGRHIIGYEVQKARAALGFLEQRAVAQGNTDSPVPLGIAGYGEGGLIALYTAAIDMRVKAALVSGYFDNRQNVWEEPIYRNVFGLLEQFGDAEIASLIWPRHLVVEHSAGPEIKGPPPPSPGRSGAAPGRLTCPDYQSVELECDRANRFLLKADRNQFPEVEIVCGNEGSPTGPAADRALSVFLKALGTKTDYAKRPGPELTRPAHPIDFTERQRRQVSELEGHTQNVLHQAAKVRDSAFWKRITTTNLNSFKDSTAPFRTRFWQETIGRLPAPSVPPNPRSRTLPQSGTNWIGYEVALDVYPDVFAWGWLLVPNDLKQGERRPVVVCQHGLEGLPADVVVQDTNSHAYATYKGFAAQLASNGFVVFAPHNPYRGGNEFRQLQRKANPLGKSLFSVIIAQHTVILDWLARLPFVDPGRIGFYGLSYGGKTAMRVPAVLDRYALSICSGDFNDWVRKNVTVDFPVSYMFTGEYEMPEWDLGHTFNYAEMAALIAPRPFMVERGHSDPVGLDEWVESEYRKVRHLYDELGIPGRTEIEFFDGPHTINAQGTFRFLHKWLEHPSPRTP